MTEHIANMFVGVCRHQGGPDPPGQGSSNRSEPQGTSEQRCSGTDVDSKCPALVAELSGTNDGQEWGLKFPVEVQEQMKERTKLKRLATVEVGRL